MRLSVQKTKKKKTSERSRFFVNSNEGLEWSWHWGVSFRRRCLKRIEIKRCSRYILESHGSVRFYSVTLACAWAMQSLSNDCPSNTFAAANRTRRAMQACFFFLFLVLFLFYMHFQLLGFTFKKKMRQCSSPIQQMQLKTIWSKFSFLFVQKS